jgi:hypothetical protein
MVAMAERTAWRAIGGLTALVGALLWGVKSATILLIGYQPPLVFEAAPALFALTVASLASGHTARLAKAALALGAVNQERLVLPEPWPWHWGSRQYPPWP